MDRIYASGAAGSAPSAPASPSSGYPTAGNPGTGTPATKPGPYWYHMIMEELMAIITAGGITPAPGTLNQVKKALDALYMPITASVGSSVQGSFKNLQLSAAGTSANVSISADEIVVENASNAYKTLRAVNLTVAGVSSGVANGLDTGTLASSTWYSIWVIWNGTTAAGLLSLSATTPTMPGGYTHKARVGWIRTDGTANKYPLGFKQFGLKVQYLVAAGSNVSNLPIMASGAAGSTSTPTWSAVAVGSFVPSTAGEILVGIANNNTNGTAMAAPNNSYGALGSITNPPPVVTATATAGGLASSITAFSIESANIYWASSGATAALYCAGWVDNI
jgi:hypothetical protein